GIITFVLKEKVFSKALVFLVAFAAGTLLGVSFIHLIPKSFEKLSAGHGHLRAPLIILGGFVFFFILEQYLHWHHCHKAPQEHGKKPFSMMILIANGIHNFVDGILVGSAFLIDIRLGITTAVAVASHELPQELGNYGVLVYGGWNKMKALVVNFAVSLSIVPGGIFAYMTAGVLDPIYIAPFAAGGFIYIGAADLVPEIHSCQKKVRQNFAVLAVFLLGIGAMAAVELFTYH
ncbi:MAG: ZIP family metal transporter, partial [Elusimicrobiota bacterium]